MSRRCRALSIVPRVDQELLRLEAPPLEMAILTRSFSDDVDWVLYFVYELLLDADVEKYLEQICLLVSSPQTVAITCADGGPHMRRMVPIDHDPDMRLCCARLRINLVSPRGHCICRTKTHHGTA